MASDRSVAQHVDKGTGRTVSWCALLVAMLVAFVAAFVHRYLAAGDLVDAFSFSVYTNSFELDSSDGIFTSRSIATRLGGLALLVRAQQFLAENYWGTLFPPDSVADVLDASVLYVLRMQTNLVRKLGDKVKFPFLPPFRPGIRLMDIYQPLTWSRDQQRMYSSNQTNDEAASNKQMETAVNAGGGSVGLTHRILFNSYGIVRGHLLVCPAEFQSQTELPNALDLAAVSLPLQALDMLAYYNSGGSAGVSSQPHKHIQMVPKAALYAEGPVVLLDYWMRETVLDAVQSAPSTQSTAASTHQQYHFCNQAAGILSSDNMRASLRVHHSCAVVPPPAFFLAESAGFPPMIMYRVREWSQRHTSMQKAKALANVLEELQRTPCPLTLELTTEGTKRDYCHELEAVNPSYSMVWDQDFCVVVPRKASEFGDLNSLTFSGHFFVKNQMEWDALKRSGKPGDMYQSMIFGD
eukprot:TRINITY_DN104019_c0_g1_i1.p1 TRINITY_DN104019_c0_g1~~TRINITY_DN104019_c0_g1_i1.p1  ORF type:complete len:504 (-),score=30.00 TRINITY_DN104019_c0_g1_i1:42-1436(-)